MFVQGAGVTLPRIVQFAEIAQMSGLLGKKSSDCSMFMHAIEIKKLFFTKPIRPNKLEESSMRA
jgi:hypothetical protein